MYENSAIPEFDVNGRTLVFDREAQRQVMWLNSVLLLPIGAVIKLADGTLQGSATVVGHRLLPGNTAPSTGGPTVCLDCTVTPEWWEQHDRDEEYRQAAQGIFPTSGDGGVPETFA